MTAPTQELHRSRDAARWRLHSDVRQSITVKFTVASGGEAGGEAIKEKKPSSVIVRPLCACAGAHAKAVFAQLFWDKEVKMFISQGSRGFDLSDAKHGREGDLL